MREGVNFTSRLARVYDYDGAERLCRARINRAIFCGRHVTAMLAGGYGCAVGCDDHHNCDDVTR